jgi:hypothetical protein
MFFWALARVIFSAAKIISCKHKELVLITDLGLEKFLIGSTNDELP